MDLKIYTYSPDRHKEKKRKKKHTPRPHHHQRQTGCGPTPSLKQASLQQNCGNERSHSPPGATQLGPVGVDAGGITTVGVGVDFASVVVHGFDFWSLSWCGGGGGGGGGGGCFGFSLSWCGGGGGGGGGWKWGIAVALAIVMQLNIVRPRRVITCWKRMTNIYGFGLSAGNASGEDIWRKYILNGDLLQ